MHEGLPIVVNILILAGGSGTRLWPLSRETFPKQFLPLASLINKASLLEQTIRRVTRPIGTLEAASRLQDVYLLTSESIRTQVAHTLDHIGHHGMQDRVLAEPCRRNTAPAIALAARYLAEQHSPQNPEDCQQIVAVLPSDHVIFDEGLFCEQLRQAQMLAHEGWLVTLGVRPSHPETGYGYIEVEDSAQERPWIKVRRFVEKPNYETAKAYVESRRFFWNAGIFIFRIDRLFHELMQHAPDIYQIISQGYDYAVEHFAEMPNVSFDYAVMEHAQRIAVVPLKARWSDLGSWDSVYDLFPKDSSGNVVLNPQEHINQEAKNCLVWNDGNRMVATIGLDDVLVIDTPDALLISKSSRSQEVREVVDALKLNKAPSALRSLEKHIIQSYAWGSIELLKDACDGGLPTYQIDLLPQQTLEIECPLASVFTVTKGRLSLAEAAGRQTAKTVNHEAAHTLVTGHTHTLVPECTYALTNAGDAGVATLIWIGQPPVVQRVVKSPEATASAPAAAGVTHHTAAHSPVVPSTSKERLHAL